MDLVHDPNGPAGDSTAAVRSRTGVPSPEPTSSPAHSASPTIVGDHDAPTTPLYSTSFIADETQSTLSQDDSWASFSHELLYEFPVSLGMAATMQEPREEPTAAARARKSSIPLPKSGATLDMAFFLKNTGPDSDGKHFPRDKVNLKRMGLGIFKKKREDDASNQKAVYSSPPHDRAEPKVTLQGSHIVPHPIPFKIEGLNISKTPNLLAPNSPHHLSVPQQEDNPDAYGTETIDNWISTFTTTNQDGFDFPTSEGISLLYNTPSNSSERNSCIIPSQTLPWLPDGGDFKLDLNHAFQYENQAEEKLQLYQTFGSNPPPSPEKHKRSTSIFIPSHNGQVTCTFENESPDQFIEATSESRRDKPSRRAAELMAGQGSIQPAIDAEQAIVASSSNVKCSKALPFLPSEAVESANNNNFTTSSMLQMWRQRDAAAANTSVKATYIPRSRRTTMIKSFQGSENQEDDFEDYTQAGAQRDLTPPSTARSSQLQVSAESTPTTNRNSMTLSQVMLVAEQMPVPRGRHVNKPAPLFLRGRHGGKTKAIAVREGDLDTDCFPVQTTVPAPPLVSTPQTGASQNSTGETPVLLQPIKFKDPQRPAPRAPSPAPVQSRYRDPSPQPTGVPAPSQTPPGVPARSLARLNSTTDPKNLVSHRQQYQDSSASHSSAPSQAPPLSFPKRTSSLISKSRLEHSHAHIRTQNQNQAHSHSPPQSSSSTIPYIATQLQPQPPPARQTCSRASNHANTTTNTAQSKKDMKMAVEYEALRRENKLLQAALMAVLKTGERSTFGP
ncbi:hypothetical protein FKW77_008315 [Venturia effusa]|uniref:Uncharacterized protein n=1 Tax=Venturia effusa TaxID=50376 RepID=A0A517L3W3_9PEZI|nr:hypothetical protein FKW77_008315 [Venturia effusa]